ncbi:hypothetical protein IQ06DRAFT_294668 [Phaeosphaeriaceae sp. SRC1lsM3a]|nr:hypothetical protein IQ06DRAFT_294668 [Stagonospora sp. SRC1lsM3a]
MTSPIERLPVEVFEIILSELELGHYQQLRLSSRQLHSLSLSPFAKKYFTDITTTLGSPSLNRLDNISSHAYFRHVVTQLNIKLLTYRDYKTLMAIKRVGIFPPPKRFPVVRGVRPTEVSEESTLFDDLKDSKNGKCITERLARSLVHLVNIKAVCFRALHSEPQGWAFRNMPGNDQVFRQKCFQVVVEAIIQSGVQLEEFTMAKQIRTKANKIVKSADLECPALQLHGSSASSLVHSFSHLRSLTLSLISNREHSTLTTRGEFCPSHFITCAPSLKHLTLKLDRGTDRSTDSATVFRSIARTCRLPALESFHLLNCALYSSDLELFLVAHAQSLCTLSLNCVQVLSGTWVAIWTALKGSTKLQLLTAARLDSPSSPPFASKRYSKKTLDVESSEKSMEDMLEELVVSSYADKDKAPQGLADTVGMWV